MNKQITQTWAACLLAAAIIGSTLTAGAQEKKKDQSLPFNGKVAAVDKAANTVKVGERVFHLSAETRITKGGKPATLADAVVGEEVAGAYKKAGDKLEASSIRFGPKVEGEPKGKGKAKGQKKEETK